MDFESVKTFEKRSDESLKHSNLRMNQLSVDSDRLTFVRSFTARSESFAFLAEGRTPRYSGYLPSYTHVVCNDVRYPS